MVVVGGGNTAIDVSRTAVRMGAEHVTIVYRRREGDMPACLLYTSAQKQFERDYTKQRPIDEVVRAIGKAVCDNGKTLGEEAFAETGMGNLAFHIAHTGFGKCLFT